MLQLGSVNVGANTTGTVTFTFSGTVAVTGVSVVTQGAAALDFQLNSSAPGTCMATTYTSGQSCTVGVRFTPTSPGLRLGAALLAVTGNTEGGGVGYLSGVGAGGELVFPLSTGSATLGSAASGTFYYPSLDGSGNIYSGNDSTTLFKFTSTGTRSSFYVRTAATFLGSAVDGAGNVYVISNGANAIYELSPSGTLLTTLPASGTSLNAPRKLAFDGSGNLYVADYGGGDITVISPTGVASKLTVNGYTFSPYGVAVDASGTVYIADRPNDRILKVTSGGTASIVPVSGATLNSMYDLAVDPAGDLFVANAAAVYFITSAGAATQLPTYATTVTGIALDRSGNLYPVVANSLYKTPLASTSFTTSSTQGYTSPEAPLNVQNIGSAQASVSSISIAAPFQLGPSNTCSLSATVASDATCALSIQFAPTSSTTPQTGTATVTGATNTLSVSLTGNVSGTATKLLFFTTPPTPITAGGNTGVIQVIAEDASSRYVTSPGLAVTLTVTDTSAGYSQTYNATTGTSGLATFDTSAAALTISGTYTYTLTSSGLTTATKSVVVKGGPAASLTVTPSGTTTFQGAVDTMTISSKDAYGNTSTSTDTVAVTTTDPAATGAGNVTLVAGTGTDPITFNTVGMFTVTATDTTNSGVTPVSANITVTVPPAYTVTVATDPASGTASNCTNQNASSATPDTSCSLRDAFAAVTALGNTIGTASVTISFASSLYGQTLTLGAAQSVTGNVSLAGPGAGANAITLSGGGSVGFLTQTASTSLTSLTGLTFSNFKTSSSGAVLSVGAGGGVTLSNDAFLSNQAAGGGGAVYVSGANPTSVTNSYFYFNHAASGSGGALYVAGGTMTLQNDTFNSNTATGSGATETGGAVAFAGSTAVYTILDTSFDHNTLTNTGTGSSLTEGAAFYGASTSTSNLISGCSLTNNTGYGIYVDGGALYFEGGEVANTLIADNSASGSTDSYGGGMYIPNATGTFVFVGDTFAGNMAVNATYNNGGAMLIIGGTKSITFYNVTIAQNTASADGGVDSGNAITAYNSVISDNTNTDEVDVSNGGNSYIGSPTGACSPNCALLSPLGSYGSPLTVGAPGHTVALQSMLPLPGSPLLAAGSASYLNGATTDQRGYARTTSYNNVTHVDIGAAEANYTLAFASQPQNSTTTANIAGSPSVQIYESGVPFTASSTTGSTLGIAASEGTLSISSLTTATTGPESIAANIPTPETDDTLLATITNNGTTGTVVANATSAFFNVSDSSAASIAFTNPPTPTIKSGGNAGVVQVGLYNSSGVLDTTSSAAVTLNVSGPSGYTASYGPTAASSGVATFNLTGVPLTTAGTYSYMATAVSYTSDSATAIETVTSDTVDHFVVSGIASRVESSVVQTFTVTAVDASGNTDTAFTGNVILTSSDSAATFLPENYTYNTSDAGVHTFYITFATAGYQSVTATTDGGQTGSETNIFVITNYIWAVNATGTVEKFYASGTSVTGVVGMSGTSSTLGGVAFDSSGNVWSVTNANSTLDFVTKTGASAATYSGGGLNAPTAVAVDGAGYIWTANSGNASVTEFSGSTFTAVSESTGYSATANGAAAAVQGAPSSIAIDNTGGVWVANKTGNSVTHIFGAATPVTTPLQTQTQNNTAGTKP